MIGVERAGLTLCLGDAWSVACDAGGLSGRAVALPVAGRRERQPRAPTMEEMGLRKIHGDDSEDARTAQMRAAKSR